MISSEKEKRIKKLYLIYKDTGQDEFPFNDKEIKGGLNIYFGNPPALLLFTLEGVIGQPIYVGVNEVNKTD